MTPAAILDYVRTHGITMLADGDRLVLRADVELPLELVEAAREHKQELLAALQDWQEACEERAAILEYDYGMERAAAERKAKTRVQYVTCESCAHWTGNSPCGAGLHTSGDPLPGVAVRICGFHTPKGVHS